jgi:hypothetical protein
MARQSAAARKRRPRAKRASKDARDQKAAVAEPIEWAAENIPPIAEPAVAAAEPIVMADELGDKPLTLVQEPSLPEAEPVAAIQPHFVPAERPLTLVRIPDMPADEPALSADEPPMPVPASISTPAQCKARLDRITRQWCDLAERRLQYYTELYRSGRWRRYYTEERFVVVMNEVAKTVANWRALADRMAPPAAGNDDMRLSA